MLEKYRAKVEALGVRHGIALSARCYPSAEALLFAMEDAPLDVDILYLDVQMKALGGIDAAKKLRAAGCLAQIIFLTNSRESVFDSFDAQPLQYFVKDAFSDEKFEEVFLRAAALCARREAEQLICERGALRQAIPLREIAYFEVIKRIVTVHYSGGTFDFYSSIDELEERLSAKGFVRAHRAFLVNVARIRRLTPESLLLTDGGEVPLGRTHAKRVRDGLSRFLSSETDLAAAGGIRSPHGGE